MQRSRLAMAVGFAALLTGDVEVYASHLIGLGLGALLLRRLMSQRRVPRLKR